jgi:glycosyltransferase involved in cell wall biosynthesis
MKVAIVHYWFLSMRGGERVIETLLEMFPDADIYTHVYNPKKLSPAITGKNVTTSYIQKLPFAKTLYKLYMPLMPNALLDFNLQDYDLIISSESGPAKGVVPNPDAFHVCYCHSPVRYFWDMYHEYCGSSNIVNKIGMRLLVPKLRSWDVVSANLVDKFISNSSYVSKRIKRYYGRDSEIVFPPVDVEKYCDVHRDVKDYYLFLGQNVPYKRLDLALAACCKVGRKLVVAGGGIKKSLKRKWEQTGAVRFLGQINESEKATLFSEARALLFPGIEDFGMVPVEANAAGCPVIAYKKGGAVDSVIENKTGIFFTEQSAESLSEAILKFEADEKQYLNRDVFTKHVQQFSKEKFKENIQRIVDERMRM